MKEPRVGVCVALWKVNVGWLMGQRLGNHGQGTYSFPGGALEYGETIQDCAYREVKEETNLEIIYSSIKAVTINDYMYPPENGLPQRHWVTIFMKADVLNWDHLRNVEPLKNDKWEFYRNDNLPLLLMPSINVPVQRALGMRL